VPPVFRLSRGTKSASEGGDSHQIIVDLSVLRTHGGLRSISSVCVSPNSKPRIVMTANLQNPIFQDNDKAREWLEARVWPNGPVCPHCGCTEGMVTRLMGKEHRPGVFQCNGCREQFTVTVKTVFERSKLPLSKWMAALFLMTASKKGVSAHQMHRMLDISYKSTWFMMHRLREAMRTISRRTY
jgi:transposase-like protein